VNDPNKSWQRFDKWFEGRVRISLINEVETASETARRIWFGRRVKSEPEREDTERQERQER
jgi:hypothetical protein